jgi:hypothetical protein
VGLSGPARDTPARADARPLILKTAAVDVQDVIDAVQSGGTVRHVLGANATLTEARPISAFGSVAYMLTGDRGWCLVAPDDALSPTANPVRTGGLTCQTLDSIYRFGIALIVGHNLIAALPQGVPAPTLTDRDGDDAAPHLLRPGRRHGRRRPFRRRPGAPVRRRRDDHAPRSVKGPWRRVAPVTDEVISYFSDV